MMELEVHSNTTSRHTTSHAGDPGGNPRPQRQPLLANPGRLPQCRKKLSTDRQFVEQRFTDKPTTRAAIVAKAQELGISRASVDRYLPRLADASVIASEYGLYWRKTV